MSLLSQLVTQSGTSRGINYSIPYMKQIIDCSLKIYQTDRIALLDTILKLTSKFSRRSNQGFLQSKSCWLFLLPDPIFKIATRAHQTQKFLDSDSTGKTFLNKIAFF